MASGALRVAAGFARDCSLALDITPALGAPRGLSRVCYGCDFHMPGSAGDDSALFRVALLDTDLLPSPSSMVTVALLFNFSLFQLCGFTGG